MAKACEYLADLRKSNQRLGERVKVSEEEAERLRKENARLRKILTENGLKDDVKHEESL